jgi:dihydrofolate reductase
MAVKISLIAAVGENLELGAKNEMLWHLPDDFAWFVKHTKGHPIIMGRKTMESLGRPLKNRRNLVVTRNAGLIKEGFEIFPSMVAAIDSAKTTETDEIFIIGGGEIYKQSLPFTDRIYLTRVHTSFAHADTFFPPIGDDWMLAFSEKHVADERHQYDFEFQILERIHA